MTGDRLALAANMLRRYAASGSCGPKEGELVLQLAAELDTHQIPADQLKAHADAGVMRCVDTPCKICGARTAPAVITPGQTHYGALGLERCTGNPCVICGGESTHAVNAKNA